MNHVGKNIKALRKQRGWNQRHTAEQLNISVPAFSKIETGITDLNISRLDQIARLFGITPAELLTEDRWSSDAFNSDQLKAELAKKEEELIRLQQKVIELYEKVRSA